MRARRSMQSHLEQVTGQLADLRALRDLAVDALKRLGIDERGLCETDRRILIALHRAGGGPVGIKTIAVAVGEEPETVEDVYEPFLLTEGWLLRTPRGRRLTDRAAELLAKSGPKTGPGQGSLF